MALCWAMQSSTKRVSQAKRWCIGMAGSAPSNGIACVLSTTVYLAAHLGLE